MVDTSYVVDVSIPFSAYSSILHKLRWRLTPPGLYAFYTLVVLWEVTDDYFYGSKKGKGGVTQCGEESASL